MPEVMGMRQCQKCSEFKALTAFSPSSRGGGGYQPYCKACRNQQAKDRAMLGRRKDRQVRKPARVEIWPRTLGEALLDVSARKWRGPVSREPLRGIA